MVKIDLKQTIKNASENIKDKASSLPDSIKNIDINESMNVLKEKSMSTLDSVKKAGNEAITNVSKMFEKHIDRTGLITIKGAMKVFYLTMAIDNDVKSEELEKFEFVGNDIDQNFNDYKNEIISEMNQIVENTDKEDFVDNIRDSIGDIVRSSINVEDSVIPGKLFIWNLMAISFSDGECSDEEAKLIRYIAKLFELDKSIVSEMEHTIRTLMAIEKEEEWLKTTSREYSKVEPKVEELLERKKQIMQGIHALLVD